MLSPVDPSRLIDAVQHFEDLDMYREVRGPGASRPSRYGSTDPTSVAVLPTTVSQALLPARLPGQGPTPTYHTSRTAYVEINVRSSTRRPFWGSRRDERRDYPPDTRESCAIVRNPNYYQLPSILGGNPRPLPFPWNIVGIPGTPSRLSCLEPRNTRPQRPPIMENEDPYRSAPGPSTGAPSTGSSLPRVEIQDSYDDASSSTPLLSHTTRLHARTYSMVVYACFLCLGLGTLLPWNFFITAESYWQYKFRNTTNSTLGSDEAPSEPTELQKLYTPMLVCLSQVTNFTMLIVNALFSHRLSMRLRLMTSLVLMLLLFTVTTALVKVDSDDWQTGFFVITMIIIVLLNSCGAIFQGGLFGMAGMFPARYMTATMSGQALGGVFASVARIISLAVGADDISSAFIYFLIAVIVLGATVVALYYLSTTEMYEHYTSASASDKPPATAEEEQPLTPSELVAHSTRVFKQIWPLGLSVSAVFCVTLAVFPAVCVKITSTSDNATWSDVYFQPVLTFLLFNVGDLVGRQVGGIIKWPRPGSRLLYVLVALRLVFIPLLLLCNHASTNVPVVFSSDVAYFIIMALFALSNGYLGTLCLIYAPRSVTDNKDAERAGSVMAAMIGLGLMLGAATSFGFGMIL